MGNNFWDNLDELDFLLEDMFGDEEAIPPIPEESDGCKHEWKEVPGFLHSTVYVVCKHCKVDKEEFERKYKR
jgi:hypothetical protein